jgi:hypothetical protein
MALLRPQNDPGGAQAGGAITYPRFPAAHLLQRLSGRIRTIGKSKRGYCSAKNNGYASVARRHVSTFGRGCGAGKSGITGAGGSRRG